MNSSPGELSKQYGVLYHNFTEAYANVDQITRDFYPITKRFIEGIEPEINTYMSKMSEDESLSGPKSHQALLKYMNHFDDFILKANGVFSEVKKILDNSNHFLTKVVAIKSANSDLLEDKQLPLILELKLLLDHLVKINEQVMILDNERKRLETSWHRTKVKLVP
ncbi:MAG: hypothetical protein JWO06_4075 [Bacteroidota bacterium]|nr:hypothetical protein [Bacteroidota bacterium]